MHLDRQIQIELLTALKMSATTMLCFEAAGGGEIDARFESGHIAIRGHLRVFPNGEARELLHIEAKANGCVAFFVAKHDARVS